jgi:glycosyltransferase involved in cell wall biosynthesis
MICRNEEKVIQRALESVKAHIDSWVVVDTGSTDRTKEIIVETMQGMQGFLTTRTWIDFGHNRTEALRIGSQMLSYRDGPENPAPYDYLLILDADDVVEAEPGAFKNLSAPAYEIRLRHQGGNPTYWKIHLLRTGGDWRYEGATHEVLVSPSGLHIARLEGPIYWCLNDGARAADPKAKYLRDAELLEEQHRKLPGDNRTIFYLAQSYHGAEELQKALITYKKRIQAGGFAEEVYLSFYNIALIYEALGMGAFITTAYLDAWKFRPSRAEPLYRLARYHAARKEWSLAHLYASQARQIPPVQDTLCSDDSVYAWRCLDEYALACSWTERPGEAVQVWGELLNSGKLPESEHGRVAEYLQARIDQKKSDAIDAMKWLEMYKNRTHSTTEKLSHE